jgi:YidC/Oxa1 family membrane protein insertase
VLPLANILQPLIDVFAALLRFLHDSFGLGWGAAIIAMTVAIRLVLLPLTLKQTKSMQALARLAPDIKALQEKYKHDKQRLNQEMMRFYQENKVNPLASCLPLLAQMPVFISLFYMLRGPLRNDICGQEEQPCGAIEGDQGESFLFIADLTDRATGGTLVVLIVLYIGSQLGATLLTPATMDKNQRRLFLALPFVFVLFVVQFPAGLMVYWITTNLWTVGQGWYVRRVVGPIRPPGTETGESPLTQLLKQVRGEKPEPAPAGGAQARAGGGNGKAGSGARAASKNAPKKPARVGGPPPARRKKKRSGRRR